MATDIEELAAKSKYTPLWQTLNSYVYDVDNPNYGSQWGASRSAYGTFKAYTARKDFEQTMYENGAAIEDVAMFRFMNENYDALSKDISILYNPEFVGAAMNNYVADEAAYEQYAMASSMALNTTSSVFAQHVRKLSESLQDDDDIRGLWDQMQDNEIQRRELALADIDNYDDFKAAAKQFKYEADIANKEGNIGTFITDIPRRFASAAYSSFTDLFISLYDFVPIVTSLFVDPEEMGGFMKGWLDSGAWIRDKNQGVSDIIAGESKYRQYGKAGTFAMDISGALGSVVGIVGGFMTGGAAAKGISAGAKGTASAATSYAPKIASGAASAAKGATKAKTLVSTIPGVTKAAKAGTFATKGIKGSAWIATQQGASVYYTGLEEGKTSTEMRSAYIATAAMNMVLLRATGAIPGSEVKGGAKLFTPTRAKQIATAFVIEGFEENLQQNIETSAQNLAGDDADFTKFVSGLFKFDLRTFFISGIAGAAMGGSHHVQANRVVNDTYNFLNNDPVLAEQIKWLREDFTNNPEINKQYGVTPNMDEIKMRDSIINLFHVNNNGVYEASKDTMRESLNEIVADSYAESSFATWNITKDTLDIINTSAKEIVVDVGTTFHDENLSKTIWNFGMPTHDAELAKESIAFITPDELRAVYAVMPDMKLGEDVLTYLKGNENAYKSLKQNEITALTEEFTGGVIKPNETIAINEAQEIYNKKNADFVDFMHRNDLSISDWNNMYGARNIISQTTYSNIKEGYNNQITELKNSIATNDIETAKKQAAKLSPKQITALANVADGVSLTPMEVKWLQENGFKSDDENAIKTIDLAIKLDKLSEKVREQKLKEETLLKAKIDKESVNYIQTNELAKYTNNVDLYKGLLKDGGASLLSSQEQINVTKTEIAKQETKLKNLKKKDDKLKEGIRQSKAEKAVNALLTKITNQQKIDKFINQKLKDFEAMYVKDKVDNPIPQSKLENTLTDSQKEMVKKDTTTIEQDIPDIPVVYNNAEITKMKKSLATSPVDVKPKDINLSTWLLPNGEAIGDKLRIADNKVFNEYEPHKNIKLLVTDVDLAIDDYFVVTQTERITDYEELTEDIKKAEELIEKVRKIKTIEDIEKYLLETGLAQEDINETISEIKESQEEEMLEKEMAAAELMEAELEEDIDVDIQEPLDIDEPLQVKIEYDVNDFISNEIEELEQFDAVEYLTLEEAKKDLSKIEDERELAANELVEYNRLINELRVEYPNQKMYISKSNISESTYLNILFNNKGDLEVVPIRFSRHKDYQGGNVNVQDIDKDLKDITVKDITELSNEWVEDNNTSKLSEMKSNSKTHDELLVGKTETETEELIRTIPEHSDHYKNIMVGQEALTNELTDSQIKTIEALKKDGYTFSTMSDIGSIINDVFDKNIEVYNEMYNGADIDVLQDKAVKSVVSKAYIKKIKPISEKTTARIEKENKESKKLRADITKELKIIDKNNDMILNSIDKNRNVDGLIKDIIPHNEIEDGVSTLAMYDMVTISLTNGYDFTVGISGGGEIVFFNQAGFNDKIRPVNILDNNLLKDGEEVRKVEEFINQSFVVTKEDLKSGGKVAYNKILTKNRKDLSDMENYMFQLEGLQYVIEAKSILDKQTLEYMDNKNISKLRKELINGKLLSQDFIRKYAPELVSKLDKEADFKERNNLQCG